MTEKEFKDDLAIALLLLKDFKSRYANMTNGSLAPPNTDTERAAFHVLDMAKRLGVVKEFVDLLSVIPSLKIIIKELEPWPDSKGPSKKPKRSCSTIARRRRNSPPKDAAFDKPGND